MRAKQNHWSSCDFIDRRRFLTTAARLAGLATASTLVSRHVVGGFCR